MTDPKRQPARYQGIPESWSVEGYEDRFVRVGVEMLRELYHRHRADIDAIKSAYISRDRVLNPLPDVRRAVSISLFHPAPERAHVSAKRWQQKYLENLMNNLRRFREGFDPARWKVMLHYHPDNLPDECEIAAKLAQFPFVEVQVMSRGTLGQSPGALWRFLPLGDAGLDQVLILDIDQDWRTDARGWYRAVEPWGKPFSRAHFIPSCRHWLDLGDPWTNGVWKIYPTLLASKLLARPSALGLPDIDDLVATYVFLRKSRVAAGHPCTQLRDDEPITPYNRPTTRHPYGFGNHWEDYCFDERFLKHVLYYHVADRGDLCTFCEPQTVTSDLGDYFERHQLDDFAADFAYVRRASDANLLLNNGAPVEFEASLPSSGPVPDSGTPLVDPAPRQELDFPPVHKGISPDVEFHPHLDLLVVTHWGRDMILVYAADQSGRYRLVQTIMGSTSCLHQPHSVAFTPLGTRMLVNSYADNCIGVFAVDPVAGRIGISPIQLFRPPAQLHTLHPHAMALTSDGQYLACVYCDAAAPKMKIVVYHLRSGPAGYDFQVVSVVPMEHVSSRANPKGVAFVPGDRGLLMSADKVHVLMLFAFDPESGRLDPVPRQTLRNPQGRLSRPEEIAFTPCGRYFVVSNSTADTLNFHAFDLERGCIAQPEPVCTLASPEARLRFPHGVAISPDGARLAVTEYGNSRQDARNRTSAIGRAKAMIFDLHLG